MRKRVLSLLLCATMAVGVCVTSVSATQVDTYDPGIISPQYIYTDYVLPVLSISGKTATAKGNIYGYSDVTKIEYTVYLQEKNGSTWGDVTYWGGSTNASSAFYSFSSKSAISGKTYRTKTVAKVYSGTKSETITAYSSEKKA